MMCFGLEGVMFLFTFGVLKKLKSDCSSYMIIALYALYALYRMKSSPSSEPFLFDIFTSSDEPDTLEQPEESGACKNKMHPTASDYTAAYSGAGPSCEKQAGMCDPASYYKKRGDWVSQQKISNPEGAPEVQDMCGAQNSPIGVYKPCVDLETPPLKLMVNPIDTEHNQPNYRSCHERPNKVQVAHDPSSHDYSPVN
jgi:hypothetical protein